MCVDSVWKTVYPDDARKSLAMMGVSSGSRSVLTNSELDTLLAGDGTSNMESEEY